MADERSSDLVNIPPALLAEVQAAAAEDHLPVAERRWQKVFSYGEQQAHDLGLNPDAIPGLIAEYRRRPAT